MSARKRPRRASIEGLEARLLRHGGAGGNGLLGQYFNNKDFSAPVMSRPFKRTMRSPRFNCG